MFNKFMLVLALSLYISVEGNPSCEQGWTEYRDFERSHICILTVSEKLPWLQAKTYCGKRVSHLLTLDRIDQYHPVHKRDSYTIGGHILNKFKQFWSGLHLKKGRLMWDNFGPQFVYRGTHSSRPWNWEHDQPSDVTGTSGKVILGYKTTKYSKGVIKDEFNGQINTRLSQSNVPLPFVCQKPAIRPEARPLAGCDNGWIGNQFLPQCYTMVKEKTSYQDARARCEAMGATLATYSVPGNVFTETVYSYYKRNDADLRQYKLNNTNVWSSGYPPENPNMCYAFSREQQINQQQQQGIPAIRRVPCSEHLFFMCTKSISDSLHADVNFEVDSPYLDQYELLSYSPFEHLPVSAVTGRDIGEHEIVFVKTPTGYINSTGNFRQWDLSDISGPRVRTRYDVSWEPRTSAPQFVNVTLPRKFSQGLPARRRRNVYSVTDDERESNNLVKRCGYGVCEGYNMYDYVGDTTGYYSFGLYSVSTARYEETEPVLIRYAEPDLYIYVVTVDLMERVVSEKGPITRQDINSFNMLQDESYLRGIKNITAETVVISLHRFPPVRYYRGQTESVSNLTVKYRIFLSLSNSRKWAADMEQNLLILVENSWGRGLNASNVNMNTLSARSTVACSFRKYTYFDDNERNKTVTFSSKRVGEIGYSWERCNQGKRAIASSKCVGGYDDGVMWGPVKINKDCKLTPASEESPSSSTASLAKLSEETITDTNVVDILGDTVDLTDPKVNLSNTDVICVAAILYNYLQLHEVIPDTLRHLYDITDNILHVGSDKIDIAQSITNAANRILLSVDEITSGVLFNGAEMLRFVRPSVGSQVLQQLGIGSLTIGVILLKSNMSEIRDDSFLSIATEEDIDVNNTDTAVYLPINMITGVRSKLSFHIYTKTDLFTVIDGRFKTNSIVAAARLLTNDRPVFNLGDERVTVMFHPFEINSAIVCAYWNYSANEDAGGWNTDGCTTLVDGDRVTCKCNHLTNFAVLIDLQGHTISDTDKFIAGIVTKIGLSLSVIGLSLTILTFLMFKHLRRGRGMQVLVNLCVSMLCSSIIFLVGIDRTESKAGCKVVAVLLHYFILVSFMWMLVEGLLQYFRFVKVLGTYIPNFMKKTMIPAWGIPLIPVIVVLAVNHDLYHGDKGYCWMAHDAMLYAFIVPIAVIIAINTVVFVTVVYKLLFRKKKGMVSNQSEKKLAILHFQAAIAVFVILGLTWIFGVLAVGDVQVVFHYLFSIFSALQGFFIFLLYTVREKQIRKSWKKLCCQKYTVKPSANSEPHKKSSPNTSSTGLSNKHSGASDDSGGGYMYENVAME